jgi:amidohydrolase
MSPQTPHPFTTLIQSTSIDIQKYESLYKHFHLNPELSNHEAQTAATIKTHLSYLPFTITSRIGGHGLVGVFKNGSGKTIMLRADIDALPIREETGLEYSSTKTQLDTSSRETKPTMHACGHDMHMTCLLAASEILISLKYYWKGTLIVLFQPAEERGTGAKAMVDDGLYDKERHGIPVPDFVLGQHVMAFKAGTVGTRMGTLMAGADSLKITVFGRGGHGSQVCFLLTLTPFPKI